MEAAGFDRYVEKDLNVFDEVNSLKDETKKIQSYIFEPETKSLKSLRLQIIGNETISMSSEITDNFVESNVAFQDHISMKPMIYTIEGEVGELVWFSKEGDVDVYETLENKLVEIEAFLPPFSKKEQVEQRNSEQIMSVVDELPDFANRFWSVLEEGGNKKEQEKVYKYLLMLWKERTPISIQTAWTKLSNFVIQNIEISQSDRTKDKSKIKISFKEFRTVKRKTVEFDEKKFIGRAGAQNSEPAEKGTTTGTTITAQQAKPNQFYPTESGKVNVQKLSVNT